MASSLKFHSFDLAVFLVLWLTLYQIGFLHVIADIIIYLFFYKNHSELGIKNGFFFEIS